MSLKLIGGCYPSEVWYQPYYENGLNQTIWTGTVLTLFMDIIKLTGVDMPEIDITSEISDEVFEYGNNNSQHHFINVIHLGHADAILAGVAGIDYQRSKYVDFTPTMTTLDMLFISKKNTNTMDSSLIQETFDRYGYLFLGLEIVVLTIFFVVNSSLSWLDSFFFTIQIFFDKGGSNPNNYKTNKGRGLVFVLSMTSLISLTLFSGQIVANILSILPLKQIDTLEDLEAQPYLSVIVWANTKYHDWLKAAHEGKGIVNKVEAWEFLTWEETFQSYKQVLSGKSILLATYSEHNYICLPTSGVSGHDFHFSPTVHEFPSAFTFPKERSPLVQTLFDSIGWINSFHSLLTYTSKFSGGTYEKISSNVIVTRTEDHPCTGMPKLKKYMSVQETMEDAYDMSCLLPEKLKKLPKERKIAFSHLKIAFFMLLFGLSLGLVAFGLENTIHMIKN